MVELEGVTPEGPQGTLNSGFPVDGYASQLSDCEEASGDSAVLRGPVHGFRVDT